jgi:hypothetical protein
LPDARIICPSKTVARQRQAFHDYRGAFHHKRGRVPKGGSSPVAKNAVQNPVKGASGI